MPTEIRVFFWVLLFGPTIVMLGTLATADQAYVAENVGRVFKIEIGDFPTVQEFADLSDSLGYITGLAMRPGTRELYVAGGGMGGHQPGIAVLKPETNPVLVHKAAALPDEIGFSPSGRYLHYQESVPRGGPRVVIVDADTLERVDHLPTGSGSIAYSRDESEVYYVAKGALRAHHLGTESTRVIYEAVNSPLPLPFHVDELGGIVARWIDNNETSVLRISEIGNLTVLAKKPGRPFGNSTATGGLWTFNGKDGRVHALQPHEGLLTSYQANVAGSLKLETSSSELPGSRKFSKEDMLRHSKGFISPDERYCVLVYDPGYRRSGWVTILDNRTGDTLLTKRVGGGGLTNVVFDRLD